MRAWACTAAAVVLVGCGGASSDEQAARHTVETYYAALDRGDGRRACAQLDEAGARKVEADVARYTPGRTRLPCAQATKYAVAKLRRAGIPKIAARVGSVDIRGDRGTVRVRLSSAGTETSPVIRHGDRWLITARTVRPPTGAAPQNVSRDDAIARANALCRDVRRRVRALGPPPTERRAIQRYARRLRTLFGPTIDALKTLTPPYEDREVYDQYVATVALRMQLVNDAADADVAGDRVQTRDLQERLSRAESLALRLAGQYGLTDCS